MLNRDSFYSIEISFLCAKKTPFVASASVNFDSRKRVSPSIDTQPDKTNRLLDDDLTGHARTLVRFAVVAVGTGDVKLVGHLLTRTVEVVFVGDGVGVDTSRDVVFIEDDVVRERLVVDEFNSLALGDGDGRRLRETSKSNKTVSQSVSRPNKNLFEVNQNKNPHSINPQSYMGKQSDVD